MMHGDLRVLVTLSELENKREKYLMLIGFGRIVDVQRWNFPKVDARVGSLQVNRKELTVTKPKQLLDPFKKFHKVEVQGQSGKGHKLSYCGCYWTVYCKSYCQWLFLHTFLMTKKGQGWEAKWNIYESGHYYWSSHFCPEVCRVAHLLMFFVVATNTTSLISFKHCFIRQSQSL